MINPGSREAQEAGCTCPVLDNEFGRGWMGGVKGDDGEILFVYRSDCPLHSGGDEFKREISKTP